jgi:hypothetical protein
MHSDDLNNMWVCHQCKMRFIFIADMEDHRATTGHSNLTKYDLLSGELVAP